MAWTDLDLPAKAVGREETKRVGPAGGDHASGYGRAELHFVGEFGPNKVGLHDPRKRRWAQRPLRKTKRSQRDEVKNVVAPVVTRRGNTIPGASQITNFRSVNSFSSSVPSVTQDLSGK